jgi:hypothetical protein
MTEYEALQQAAAELGRQVERSEKLRSFRFEPVRLHSEYDCCWVFAASSPDMLAADYAPAALFIYLDKADGHRWDADEIGAYFSQPRQPLQVAA